MRNVLKVLKEVRDVLTLAGAVLAAAIVAVETYQELRKKIGSGGEPYAGGDTGRLARDRR